MAYNNTKLHTWGPSVTYPRGRPNDGAQLDAELDRAYESLNDLHARLLAGITNAPTWSETDKAPTAAQVASRIAQAISDLLDGAPGALDTLNELAAALGDDANFASTVTTALAARYLKTEIDAFFEGESGGKKQVSWNRLTDVPSIEGQRRAHAGGTADAISATFTPTVTSLTDGMTVFVRASAANTISGVVFQADGTAAKPVVKGADKALIAGDIAGAGHWLELQFDTGLDKWILQNPAGGVDLPVRSLAANGYQKLPSGLIIQWGSATTAAGADASIVFPVAFPTAAVAFTGNVADTANSAMVVASTTVSGASVAAWYFNGTSHVKISVNIKWIAIGY